MNDGNNYRGLMSVADYKSKRTEIIEDTAEKRAKDKADKLKSALEANRAAATQAERERQERELQRKEKLKRELAAAQEAGGDEEEEGGAANGGGSAKKKKKKKAKVTEASGLSFDAEEE